MRAMFWDGLLGPVREAAASLLRSTMPRMSAPPVSLSVICDYLDIQVYAQPCDAFGALLAEVRGRRILMVNTAIPLVRARFSIAHELGHALLGHRSALERPSLSDERQERQADLFAAELLMPLAMVAAEAGAGPEALARRYRVSRQAMTLRLRSISALVKAERPDPVPALSHGGTFCPSA